MTPMPAMGESVRAAALPLALVGVLPAAVAVVPVAMAELM